MSSATSSTPGSGAHTVASSEMNQSPPRHLVIHAVHSEKMNGAPPRQSAAHQVTSLSTDAGPVKPAPAHAVTAEESDVKVASLAATPAVASEEKEVRAPKSSPVHAVPVEEAETQAPQHDGVHAVTSEEMAVPAPRESGSLEKAAADMLQDNPENEAGKEELSPDCGRGSLNTEVFNRRCSQSLSRLRDGAPSRAASIAGPRSEGENATSAPVIESSKVDEGTITSGAALFPVPKVAPLADFRQGAEHPALLDGVLELQRPHLETWRFDSPEEANRARRQSAEVAVYVWNYLEFLSHCRAGDEEQADQEVLEEVARRAKWVSDGIPLVPVEATTEEQKLDTEDSTEKQAVIESAGDAICATAGDGDAATDTNTALNTDKPEPHTATAVAHPYGSVFEHMDEKTFGVLLRTQQIRDPALAVSVLSYVRRLSRKDPFVSERTQSEEENEDASNSDEEGCLDETLFVAGKPAALQKKEPAKIHRSGKKRRPVITVANEIFLRELALHSRNYELQCFSALANRVGGLSYEYKEATGSLVPESIATVHSHEQKRPSKEGRRHGKREDGGEQEHKKHHSHHEKGTNGHSKHQSQIIDPDNELEMLRKMEEEAEESGGTESPEAQSPGGFSDIMSGVLHGLKALILTEEEVGETFGQLTAAELEELEAWKRGDPNVKVPRLMQDKLIGDAAELEEEAEESGGGLFGSLLKTSGVQGVLDEAQAVECTPRSPSQKEAWEETCQRLKTRRYSLTPKSKAFSTSAKEREMASKDDNTMNSFMATDTELQKLARESMKEEEHQRRKQLKEETRERKNSHKMHVSKSFTGGDEEALEEEEEAKCGDAPAQVLLIEGAGQQTGGASKEDQLYGGEALDETKNNNSGIGSFFVQMLPSNVTGVRRPSRHSHRRLSKRTMSQSMENYENERGLFDDAIDSDGEVKRDSIAKKVSGSVASLIRIVTEDQDKKDRVTQPLIRNGMSGNRRKTYYRTPSLTPGEPRIRPQEVLESKAIVEQPEVIPYEDAAKSAATQPLYVPRGSRRNSKGPHHHRQHGLGGSIVAFFEDAHTAVFGGTDVRGIDEFQAGLDAMPETNNKEIVAKEKVAAFFADQRNTNSDVRPDVKEILGDDKPFGSLDDSPATVDAANPAKRAEAAVAPPADSKKRHHHRSEPEPSAKDSSRQGGSEAKSAPTAAQAPKTQPVKQGDLHIDGVTSVLAPIEDQLVLWFYEESAKASRTFFLEHQNDSLPSPFCLSSSKSTPVVASAKAAPTAASSSSTDAKATKPAILEAQNDTTMATEGVMIASYGNSAKHKKILVGEGEAMPSGQQSGPAPLLFLPEEPLADETVSKSSAATSGPRCDEISVAAETPTTTTDAPPEDRNDNHNVDTEVPEAPEARESAAEAVPLGGIAELKGKLALRKNKVDADVQLDEQKKKIEKQQEDLLKQQRRQMQGLQQPPGMQLQAMQQPAMHMQPPGMQLQAMQQPAMQLQAMQQPAMQQQAMQQPAMQQPAMQQQAMQQQAMQQQAMQQQAMQQQAMQQQAMQQPAMQQQAMQHQAMQQQAMQQPAMQHQATQQQATQQQAMQQQAMQQQAMQQQAMQLQQMQQQFQQQPLQQQGISPRQLQEQQLQQQAMQQMLLQQGISPQQLQQQALQQQDISTRQLQGQQSQQQALQLQQMQLQQAMQQAQQQQVSPRTLQELQLQQQALQQALQQQQLQQLGQSTWQGLQSNPVEQRAERRTDLYNRGQQDVTMQAVAASPMHLHSAPTAGRVPIRGDLPNPQDVQAAHSYGASRVVPPHQPAFSGRTVPPPRISPRGDQGFTGAVRRSRSPPREERPPSAMDVDFEGVEEIRGSRISGQIAVRYVAPLETRSAPTYPHAVPKIAALPGAQGPFSPRTQALKNMEARGRRQQHADERHARSHAHSRHHHALPRGAGDNRNNNVSPPSQPRHQHPQKVDDSKKELSFLERALTIPAEQAPQLLLRTDTLAPSRRVKPVEPAHRPPGSPKPRLDTPYQVKRHTLLGNIPKINIFSPKSALKRINEVPASASEPAEGDEVESYHQNVQHQKKRRMVNAEGEAAFESSQSGLFDSPTETAHVDNARGDESCFSFEPEYPSASSGNALLTEGDEDSIVEQTGKEGRSCRNVKEPISAAPQPHISQHLAQGRETPEDYFNHVTQSELRSKDTAAPESSCGTQAAKEQEAVRESWPVFAFNGNEEQIESCSQDDEGAGSLSTPDQVLETDSVPAGRAFPQSVVEAALPDLVHQTSNLDVAELVAEEGGSHQFMTNPSAHGVLRSNSCSSAPRTSNYNMGVDHLQGYGMDVAALLRDSLDEMSENDQEHDATFTTQATVTLAEARSGASPIAGFLVVQDSDVDAEAVMYNNKSTSVFANSAFPSHREMHSLDLGSLLETDNSERAGTTCSSQDGGAPRLKLSPRNLDMLPRVQTATQANAAAAWTSAGGPPQLRNDSSSASLNTEVEVITYLPSTVANMVSPPPSVVGGAIETQSTALGSASQGGGSSSERDHQMIPESRTEHPTASEDVSTDMSRREVSTGPTNVKNRIKMFENLSHGDSPRTGTSPRAAACPKKLNIPTAFNSPHHDHIDSTPPGHHARASSSAKPVEVSEKKRDHVEESVSISNTKNSGSTGKVLDDGQSSQEDVVPTRAFDTAAFIVPAPKAFPDAGFVDMDGGGFYQDGPFHLSDALPRVPRQTQAKQDEERFHKSFAERALARLQDGLDMHAEHEEELQELAEMMGLDVDELRRSHQFRNSTNFALNAAALGTADTLGETPRSASSSGKGVIAGEMDVDQSVFHVGDDLSHLARNRLLLEQVQKHAEVLGMSPAEVLREQLEHDQVEHQQALNHARRASATGETTIGMGAGVFNSATRPETTEATPEHQVMMQLALLQILVASEGAFRKSSISEGKYNYIAIPASMGEEAVRAASDKYSTKHPHENHEQQHQQHRQSHHNQLQQHHKNKKRQHQQQHHRQRRHSSYHRHNSVIAQGAAQDAYALDVDELTAKMAQLRLDSVSEEAHHGVSSSAGHSESVEEMQAAMGLNGRQDAALQHEQRREREAQAEKLESLRAGVAELAEDAAHAAAELAEHQADESHDHAEHDQVENRAPQGHETRAQMSHMKNANHDDEEAHLEHLEDMHKLMDSSKRLSGSILHATVGELSEDSGDEDRAAFHALARRSQNLLEQVDRILRLRPMQRAYNRLRMIRALRGGHLEATASSYSGGAEKSAAEKKIIYNNSSDLGGGYELLAGGANRFSPSWNADLRQPLVKGAEGEAAAPQEEGGEDGEQSQEQFLYYDSPSGTSGGVPSEELSPALHERTLEVGTLLLSPPDEDAPPENMSVNVNLRIQAPEGEGPPHQIQQQQQQDVPTSNVEYFQRDSSRLFSSVAAAGQDFEEVPSPVPAVPAPKRILRPVSPAMNATTSTGSDNRSFSEPRPFVIGVCGASCSGKTTVCDILRAEFMTTDSRVAFLPSDSYYKSLTDAQKALAHEGKYDFDVPEALDWQDLLRDLRTLKQGKEPVQLPMYSFKTHSRIQLPEDGSPFPDDVDLTGVSGGDVLQPSDVIIVEGILVFAAGQALLDEIDMKIFIDCDSDVRLARRLQRDIVERGREFDGILKQYLRFVRPSYTNYVEPSRRYADVIIPNNNQEHTEGVASLRRNCVISMILDHIKLHLAQRRRIRRLEQKQQEQPQQGNISEKRTATSKDSSTSSNNPGTLTPNHQHLNNLLTLSNPFSRPVSSPTSHDVPASSVTARWESSSAAGTPVIGPRKLKQKQN